MTLTVEFQKIKIKITTNISWMSSICKINVLIYSKTRQRHTYLPDVALVIYETLVLIVGAVGCSLVLFIKTSSSLSVKLLTAG